MTTSTGPVVASSTGRTLAEALHSAELHLTASGVPSPRVDAELLAAHLLGVDRTVLWRHLYNPVPKRFDALVARRAARVPLQHLTGFADFRTVRLSVGQGVFCPRPETELVAGTVIDLVGGDQPGRLPARVVDLCSGSGAIAAAVSAEAPGTEVHAVELDPAAGVWLRRNADRYGFATHIADVDGCLRELDGTVDVIAANPPYIPTGSVPLDPEVAQFDPPLALYSGDDGLDLIRVVERAAARLLRHGGVVVVEHSDQQGAAVSSLFSSTGRWTDVVDHVDLAGRDRYVTAVRAGA